ncbi:TBP family protein [Methanobrevibacter thaueri]|uniref:Transcription factor n=1 Tax=Methanobrevibacter thaueri TaxID=190975 RepID=A0A315XPQ2_9EURY|nr:TATA-box-binding family protein [Methanobrevibacter thaueri]PWB87854.1 transcription factor [Methanobrevibacter thaueri]
MMELVNIVATVEMEKPFDLEELLVKLPNVEKAHFWVKAKIPPYNKYTAFYGSGKFLVTGAKSEDELNEVANNVVDYIQKYGIDNTIKNININNRVYMDQLDFEVDLEKLIVELTDYDASYEPEQFPGMNFKDKYDLTYLLFGSGKITITGVKSLEHFEEHVAEFKDLIREKSDI